MSEIIAVVLRPSLVPPFFFWGGGGHLLFETPLSCRKQGFPLQINFAELFGYIVYCILQNPPFCFVCDITKTQVSYPELIRPWNVRSILLQDSEWLSNQLARPRKWTAYMEAKWSTDFRALKSTGNYRWFLYEITNPNNWAPSYIQGPRSQEVYSAFSYREMNPKPKPKLWQRGQHQEVWLPWPSCYAIHRSNLFVLVEGCVETS